MKRLTKDDRRRKILEKCSEVFAIKGLEGTRTRDIADACSINEALIYRHFASKEDLYREAMIFSFEKAVESWVDISSSAQSGLDGLVSVIEDQLEMFKRDQFISANMWHGIAATTHDAELRELARNRIDAYHEFLKGLIVRGREDGSVRIDADPEMDAWFLRGVTWTAMLRTILQSDEREGSYDTGAIVSHVRKMIGNIQDGSNIQP